MLNTVRLLVIYFGLNLHAGQVYFCLFTVLAQKGLSLTKAHLIHDLAHCIKENRALPALCEPFSADSDTE